MACEVNTTEKPFWVGYYHTCGGTSSPGCTIFVIYLLAMLMAVYGFFTRLPATQRKTQQTLHIPENELVPTNNEYPYITRAKALESDHATVKSFQTLIDTDGAGSWPPRAEHGSQWPRALRPYHEIYCTLCSDLPYTSNLDDDEENSRRCAIFRGNMVNLLRSRVDLAAVESILNGSSQEAKMSSASWNGFLSCIAYSRHAFR